jgi:hypothetical protein
LRLLQDRPGFCFADGDWPRIGPRLAEALKTFVELELCPAQGRFLVADTGDASMVVTNPDDVQLVVLTEFPPDADEPESRLWAAAVPRIGALKAVLQLAPLGSSAELSSGRLSAEQLAALRLRPRDIREIATLGR